MKKKSFILLLTFILPTIKVFSVSDGNDTIYLNKVTVKERFPLSTLYTSTLINGITHAENILTAIPMLSLKKYGINGLTSLSVNGLPARFTTTSWENIPLNASMSGDVNFSTLPFFYAMPIALYGNTAESPFHLKLSVPDSEYITLTTATPQNINATISKTITYQRNTLKFVSAVYHNQNRYHVTNDFLSPPEKIQLPPHPSVGYFTGISGIFQVTENWHIRYSSLYLYDQKEIIPPVFKEYASEKLFNELYGFSISSAQQFRKFQTKLSYAFSKLFLLYEDSTKNIFSHNNSYTHQLSATLTTSIATRLKTNIRIESNVDKAVTSNYAYIPIRHTHSIIPTLDYQTRFIQLSINGGGKFSSGYPPFPVYKLSFSSQPLHTVSFNISYGQYVHIPTLNDLYWIPGGNPDLQPELLHTAIMQLGWGKQKNIMLNLTSSVIKNEIRWMPVNGSITWQATNIPTSNRNSLSITYKGHITYQSVTLNTTNSFTYTSAKDNEGHYLLFVPLFKYTQTVRINLRKKLSLTLQYLYYGKRYITTENTAELPAFHLINTSIAYRFDTILLEITLYNVTNTDYAYIQAQPMPLRYAEFSVKYMFNSKNQKL